VFILKRPGAQHDYPSSIVEKAEIKYRSMDRKESDQLAHTIMIASQSFINGAMAGANGNARHQFLNLIDRYKDIDANKYRENLRYFLDNVIPAADKFGVRMAVHADDPPFSILGLPRILSTREDIEWLLSVNDSPNNGFTFCAGSLGVRPDHGNRILGDHGRKFNPGYPLTGRLKGLAEIDGLMRGIEHAMEFSFAGKTFIQAQYPD
jgi:mannonate dehydratase